MRQNKLLLDLSPLKVGGGVQLALNFVDFIKSSDEIKNVVILVSERFPFLDRLPDNCPVEIFSASPFKRMRQEHFTLPSLVKKYGITHYFTFFGLGLPKMAGVRQVISIAYPTICYDDSTFWSHLSLKNYVIKKFFQSFRLNRINKADAIIVETAVMKERMQSQLGTNSDKFSIIPPVPTAYVQNISSDKLANDGECQFLILSGLNEHKNVWRLIEVAKEIFKKNDKIKLIISVDEHYFKEKYRILLAKETSQDFLSVFDFKGNIPQDKIQNVYNQCDALLNISDLESFSNNYMEAWLSNTPIISSDRDFARGILGTSAIYCEPHSPTNVYKTLVDFSNKK